MLMGNLANVPLPANHEEPPRCHSRAGDAPTVVVPGTVTYLVSSGTSSRFCAADAKFPEIDKPGKNLEKQP
jgi:hypothetical protein